MSRVYVRVRRRAWIVACAAIATTIGVSVGVRAGWVQPAVAGVLPTRALLLFRDLPAGFGASASREYAMRLRDGAPVPRGENLDRWLEKSLDSLSRAEPERSTGLVLIGLLAPHTDVTPHLGFLASELGRTTDCEGRSVLLWAIEHARMSDEEARAFFESLLSDVCAQVRSSAWNALVVRELLDANDLPRVVEALGRETDGATQLILSDIKRDLEAADADGP